MAETQALSLSGVQCLQTVLLCELLHRHLGQRVSPDIAQVQKSLSRNPALRNRLSLYSVGEMHLLKDRHEIQTIDLGKVNDRASI